jgi:nitrogen fixation protein NifU and related proteins
MASLYQREELMEHIKNPLNYGKISGSSKVVNVVNSSCGDSLTLYLKIENGVITNFKYEGQACGVAIASASMLSQKLINKPISYLDTLTKKEVLSAFVDNLSISRKKCALLIYEAVKKAR